MGDCRGQMPLKVARNQRRIVNIDHSKSCNILEPAWQMYNYQAIWAMDGKYEGYYFQAKVDWRCQIQRLAQVSGFH